MKYVLRCHILKVWLRRRLTPVAVVTQSSPLTYLHPPADDLIHTQHTTVSAPSSQHPSAFADPSLHRSVIDMTSIHHAPTAQDYSHSCSCFHLPSCWNLSKTPFQSSSCSWCFHTICLPSTTCFCTSFFSAHLHPFPPSPSWSQQTGKPC